MWVGGSVNARRSFLAIRLGCVVLGEEVPWGSTVKRFVGGAIIVAVAST